MKMTTLFARLTLILTVALAAGCASRAEISMPALDPVYDPAYANRSISYDIYYAQPTPGMFGGGGEKQPLKPIADTQMSIASVQTMRKMPQYIKDQLPPSASLANIGQSDFHLRIEMTAYNKRGPAYADYEAAKSLGKNLLTLGLASSEYDIIADFKVRYILMRGSQQVHSQEFRVQDSVDHERGDFDSVASVRGYASLLLEKHLSITLNRFFQTASNAMQRQAAVR